MRYRVFISYGGKDRPVVDALAAHAAAIGMDTYLYEREAEGGRSIAEKIQTEIRASDAVVALLTGNSGDSAYIHQEVGYALALRKVVLPLVDVTLTSPAMAMLEGTEYISLDPNSPSDATAKMTQSLYRSRSARDNQQLVMAVVIIGLIVLLLWSQQRSVR